MSEISGGETGGSEVDSSSGEVSGERADVGAGEVSEADNISEVTEDDVDGDFSAELDGAYSSYMEEGRVSDFERKGSEDVREREETSETEETDDSLEQELDKKYNEYVNEGSKDTEKAESVQEELTEAEKTKLKAETGWSDDVIDATRSLEEAEIYKKADLQEAEINGKKCLIRQDIDMEQKDEFGRTNKERMANGSPPLTETGETVELHHIGQKQDSPLAELTTQEHRGKGNDTVLHDKQKDSEIDRAEFAKERKHHWESRSENC